MYLIVGLGNPGKEYENTRHNMGFMCIDAIALKYGVNIDKEKMGGLNASLKINGEQVILLKPQKYINLSGEVIKKYVDYYKIPIANILVISDDLDLDFGQIKIKYKGSSGGHNGLKNIELCLGTREYKRIKIGIANNKNIDTKDYVLGKIPLNQKEITDSVKNTLISVFNDFFTLSFENLMNKYNHK